jgi:hypothetical protein
VEIGETSGKSEVEAYSIRWRRCQTHACYSLLSPKGGLQYFIGLASAQQYEAIDDVVAKLIKSFDLYPVGRKELANLPVRGLLFCKNMQPVKYCMSVIVVSLQRTVAQMGNVSSIDLKLIT